MTPKNHKLKHSFKHIKQVYIQTNFLTVGNQTIHIPNKLNFYHFDMEKEGGGMIYKGRFPPCNILSKDEV